MARIALLQADRQHIAVRGVQDRVFGKIHQDGETVALAAAEDDQIRRFFVATRRISALVLPASTRAGGMLESQPRR
jgi:hypothetical protein